MVAECFWLSPATQGIYTTCVCAHTYSDMHRDPPAHTQRSSDPTKNNCTLVHTWAQAEVVFVFGGVHAQVWRPDIEVRCLPSSMLPYLFEAVHLTESREDQCASLVGQNAQGSVFSLISLDMSLCVQLLYGHWRSMLKFSCLHGGDFANWAIHQDSELRATFTGMKRSTRYRPSLSNTPTCSRRHTWLAHGSQTSGPT